MQQALREGQRKLKRKRDEFNSTCEKCRFCKKRNEDNLKHRFSATLIKPENDVKPPVDDDITSLITEKSVVMRIEDIFEKEQIADLDLISFCDDDIISLYT